MLDFYLIRDDQPKPDHPEQADLEFAGALDLKTHSNLQKKELVESGHDYFSDLRWEKTAIRQIQKIARQDKFENDKVVKKLLDLIDKARLKDCGLIAYCD